MKQSTYEGIAPLAERACTLQAAIEFKLVLAAQYEAQAYRAGDMADRMNVAAKAQAKLNEANALRAELSALLAEGRRICRAAGDTLPGLASGLRGVAEEYAARFDAAL